MPPFRLARVLQLRGHIRRLRQIEADTLAAESEALAARGAELGAERDRRAGEEAHAAAAGVLDAPTFQVGRAYDDALAAAERRCRLEAERVAVALAAKRVELQTERQEERKLERLATAYRERQVEQEARAANVVLDELAMLRHARERTRSDHDRE